MLRIIALLMILNIFSRRFLVKREIKKLGMCEVEKMGNREVMKRGVF
jgi:hypothetical protein